LIGLQNHFKMKVSFETACLLKDKGFDEPCAGYYSPAGITMEHPPILERNSDYKHGEISAPELWVVQEWMWEKYGFWIAIRSRRFGETKIVNRFFAEIFFGDLVTSLETYEQPHESLEAAIVYLLNIL